MIRDICCHHWIINLAQGPTSQGVCKNCGEVKEFQNYISVEELGWGGQKDRVKEWGNKKLKEEVSSLSI